jgi:hypothetical protein
MSTDYHDQLEIPFYIKVYAIAQVVSCWLPTFTACVGPRSGHVGFVVDKVALGKVFSQYFSFPSQFSFQLLHIHHQTSSKAGIIGQTVDDVPSRLGLTPPKKTERVICSNFQTSNRYKNKIFQINVKTLNWEYSVMHKPLFDNPSVELHISKHLCILVTY